MKGSMIGSLVALLALTAVISGDADTKPTWFKRPKEAAPVVCSDDKQQNKIVPVVVPVFSEKYALKISIAYEIPEEQSIEAQSAEAGGVLSTTTDIGGSTPGRKLLQEHGASHGAYFSVNLEKIDGEEVLEFGENVRLTGYHGIDGHQYELVTPEEGGTIVQNVGLWGVHKNKCGFAVSIDVAVPISGTLSLRVRNPEDPDAEPEDVDLDVHMDHGVLTQFGTAIDHLKCVRINGTSMGVFLDGPELKFEDKAYHVETRSKYDLQIRPKGAAGTPEGIRDLFKDVIFEVLLESNSKPLQYSSIVPTVGDNWETGYPLHFPYEGVYRVVLTALNKRSRKKICIRTYDFKAIEKPIVNEIDTEHEVVADLCYCDPSSKYYGPRSQECNEGIIHFCHSHRGHPACHPNNIQRTLNDYQPLNLLVRYDFLSFLRIICPSLTSRPPVRPETFVPRPSPPPTIELDTPCDLYTVEMGFGGNRIRYPVTDSSSPAIIVACHGQVESDMPLDAITVNLLEAKHAYPRGQVASIVEFTDTPGTFLVTLKTPRDYQGSVKVTLGLKPYKAPPLTYVVSKEVLVKPQGFRIAKRSKQNLSPNTSLRHPQSLQPASYHH